MVDSARTHEVVIAVNQPLFDLPEIIAIEHGLLQRTGLTIHFAAKTADQTLLSTERDPLARFKESASTATWSPKKPGGHVLAPSPGKPAG